MPVLTVKDFSGGITDHYIDGKPNQMQYCYNLLPDANGRLEVRPAQTRLTNQHPAGNKDIDAIMPYKKPSSSTYRILAIADGELAYRSSTWTAITGPTGNEAFPSASSEKIATATWKGHWFATMGAATGFDSPPRPIKIYPSTGDNVQLRTAGLPALTNTINYVSATEQTAAEALANTLKTDILQHFTDYGGYSNVIFSNCVGTTSTSSVNMVLISVNDLANIEVGMYIMGPGIPAGTTVSSKGSGAIVMSASSTAGTSAEGFFFGNLADTTHPVPSHHAYDSSNYTTLNAVAAASNLATLLTLTNALKDAYTSHISDLVLAAKYNQGTSPPIEASYHYTDIVLGIGFNSNPNYTILGLTGQITAADGTLDVPKDATDLESAVVILNELYDKYQMHDHSNAHAELRRDTDSSFGQNAPTGTKVGPLTTGVQTGKDLGDTLAVLNQLKSDFSDHITDSSSHFHSSTEENSNLLADATDLQSAWQLCTNLRYSMSKHFSDTSASVVLAAGDYTSGSKVITGFGSTTGIVVGMYAHSLVNPGDIPFGAKVRSVDSSTQITIDMDCTATLASTNIDFSYSNYHDAASTVTINDLLGVAVQGPTYGSLTDLITKTNEAFVDYVSHDSDTAPHVTHTKGEHTTTAINAIESVTPITVAYAFLYHYSYVIDDVTHEDFGTVKYTTEVETLLSEASGVNISDIPVITNTSSDNWDTTVITCKIYRTLDAGSVYYYVDEVTNGTTTYEDKTLDADILTSPTVYTTGGVVDNDLPPRAKFIHILDGTAYYAEVETEAGETLPNRLLQSIQGDPDSVPQTFFLDFDTAIKGISSYRNKLIVFTVDSVYRIDGFFDELGRGGMVSERISDLSGSDSNAAIVQIPEGIIFMSKSGFYHTDGYRVMRINEHLKDNFADAISSTGLWNHYITGGYNAEKRQVWFGMMNQSISTISVVWVLDLRWGITPTSSFFILNGLGTAMLARSWRWDGRSNTFYMGTSNGHLSTFSDSASKKYDPIFNSSGIAVVSGGSDGLPIIWNMATTATDFGDDKNRKWVSKFKIAVDGGGVGITVRMQRIVDDGTASSLKELWTVSSEVNNLLEHTRRMPSGGLRCNFLQMRLTNDLLTGYSAMWGNGFGTPTVSNIDIVGSTGKATISTGTFPTDSVGNYISVTDTGETLFITGYDSSTQLSINRSDGVTAADATGSAWTMQNLGGNYARNFKLQAMSLYYSIRTASQDTYKNDSSDTGV